MKSNTFLSLLKRVFAGVLIGVACIMPGVSGGVIAVSMGLYEDMVHSLSHFFKSPKRNFLFLLPLAVGGAAGILLFSKLLSYLMVAYESQMLLLFMGLVLGGIPASIREGNAGGFKLRYLLSLVLGFGLISLFAILENSTSSAVMNGELNWLNGLICGGIISAGLIIPGISTSFIMLYLGMYQPLLDAIASLAIVSLVPVGIGFVVVSLLILRAVNWVFTRFRSHAYYCVTGFTIGSVGLMLLAFPYGSLQWFDALFLLAGLALALFSSRMETRKE